MSVLTLQRVAADPLYDMVVLTFKDRTPKVPYQTGFEICNGVRLAAKMAMRHEGNPVKAWRDFHNLDKENPEVIVNRTFRRSLEQATVRAWSVKWSGAIVHIYLDDLGVDMHYADALKYYVMVRLASRVAKGWAGDKSKTMRLTAHLNDAEENYKHGYK